MNQQKKIGFKRKIIETDLVKISRMKPVIKPTKPHRHEGYHEIIFLTEGEGTHTIEIDNYPIKTPVVFVLNPGQVHCWNFTKIPAGFVLMFHQTYYKKYIAGSSISIPKHGCYQVRLEDAFEIQKILELVEVEYLSGNADYLKAASHLIAVLLMRIVNQNEKNTSELSIQKSRKYEQFLDLIQKNFKQEKGVSYYASKLNITAKYLNEICQLCGQHTASYLIYSKIDEEAKRLLIHSDASVSNLAHDLGFNDTSHFAKFFSKMNGCSPTKFRSTRLQ